MFTGIIETFGKIVSVKKDRDNVEYGIESPIANELKIDQSVAHDGICLTVTRKEGNVHFVTAVSETLSRTNLSEKKIGELVNLERCMKADGRFDGHIVQGHVDAVGKCVETVDKNGSFEFSFEYNAEIGLFTVEKGSICVNGVSLTVVRSESGFFSVVIIPYTFEHTNFKNFKKNSLVNLEFDVIGKYIRKLFEINHLNGKLNQYPK
jgi:riboflavin synthase